MARAWQLLPSIFAVAKLDQLIDGGQTAKNRGRVLENKHIASSHLLPSHDVSSVPQ